MLAELYQYLRTPCPRAVRRLGYLRELIAIRARYRRVRGHWHAHLERSRQSILAAMHDCRQRHRVVVLGSGLLLDIPLAQLAAGFQQVVLVDLVHLPAVQRAAYAYPNVQLAAHDVSGIIEPLAQWPRAGSGVLPPPRAALPALDGPVDLLISANLLSQLPVVPNAYLVKRSRCGVEALAHWSRRLVLDHLALLRDAAPHFLLLTDVEQVLVDRAGQPLGRTDLLYGVELPAPLAQWRWDLAPAGELPGGCSRYSEVVAVRALD